MIELFLSSLTENPPLEAWSPWILNRDTDKTKTKAIKKKEDDDMTDAAVRAELAQRLPPWVVTVAMAVRFFLSTLLSIVAAQMAWACSKSIITAVAAFFLPSFFIIYYAFAGSKCAAYW